MSADSIPRNVVFGKVPHSAGNLRGIAFAHKPSRAVNSGSVARCATIERLSLAVRSHVHQYPSLCRDALVALLDCAVAFCAVASTQADDDAAVAQASAAFDAAHQHAIARFGERVQWLVEYGHSLVAQLTEAHLGVALRLHHHLQQVPQQITRDDGTALSQLISIIQCLNAALWPAEMVLMEQEGY